MSERNKKLSLADLEEKFFARQDIIGGNYDLNYCIPITIVIIPQEFEPDLHSRSDIVKAVEKFGNQLQKNFGKTSKTRFKTIKRGGSNLTPRRLYRLGAVFHVSGRLLTAHLMSVF